jgi:hypothetical protein
MDFKYKTRAFLKTEVFEPTKKAVALSHDAIQKAGHKLLPQSDLLYVRSVLVTAGMNGNDDVFYNSELWQARLSPVLKPMNWKHNENEIIGVMYNVFARDLATGKSIDMDIENYDKPFELITESVVYKLLFPDRASEIIQQSKAGELFVSMETWFDDYDYAVFRDDKMIKVIQRDTDTAFLDHKLKAFSGDGTFEFQDGQVGRIGRGLRKLNFGGCGFVPCPANDRSVIEAVGDDAESANANELNRRILKLVGILEDQKSDNCSVDSFKEEVAMGGEEKVIAETVNSVLDERDAKKAADLARAELEDKAQKADALEQEVNKMRSAFNTINEQLGGLLSSVTDTMKVITKTLAQTPPEIQKIDNADTGEEAFLAKLSWLQQSIGYLKDGIVTLLDKADSADEMKAKLDEIDWNQKADGVKDLLSPYVAEEQLQEMLLMAKELSNEDFDKWLSEKKVLVESVTAKLKVDASTETEAEEESTDDSQESTNVEDSEDTAEASNEDSDKTDADVEDALDDVEVENKPNISNASQEDEDEDPIGMKKVVAAIYERPSVDKTDEQKPGFDPIN